MSVDVSRRTLLFGRFRRAHQHAREKEPSRVAVIMGRHCLAYRSVTCSTCYERCPVEGAVVRERGVPRVVADLCNGCGVCRDVCPAPINAVLMLAGRPVPQSGYERSLPVGATAACGRVEQLSGE